MIRQILTAAAVLAGSLSVGLQPASADDVVVIGTDEAPPVVNSLALNPTDVDVSGGPAQIDVAVVATDDISGVERVGVSIYNGAQQVSYSAALNRISGDPLNGTWTGTLELPRYAPSGTYTVTCYVTDNVGRGNYGCTDTSVTVTGGDLAPPVVNSLALNPTDVDVSGGPAQIDVAVVATDDISGVERVGVSIYNGAQQVSYSAALNRISGDPLNGTWTGTLELPRYAPSGTYTVTCYVTDNVGRGNYGCTDTSVTVTGGDLAPPVVNSLALNPTDVDVSGGPAQIDVAVVATDDISGVERVGVSIYNGAQQVSYSAALNRISGDPLNGTWTGTLELPRYAPSGTYTVTCYVTDNVGRGNYGCTDTSVTVTSDAAPPVVAGTPDRSPNAAGWYNAPVTVGWSSTDAVDGVLSSPSPTIVATDGADQTAVSGPSCDRSGNCAAGAFGPIKLDRTPPVVTISGAVESTKYVLGAGPSPSCTASDALSGLDGPCALTVIGGNPNGVGTYSAIATARDRAGNSTSTIVTYKVIYGWHGFDQPINDTAHDIGVSVSVFKAGSTVPAKFTLTRADGTVVNPSSPPVWLAPVRGGPTSLPVDETVYTLPGDSGLFFKAQGSGWHYNWNSEKGDAGYYWRIGVRLDDGEMHTINIALR